MREKIAYRDPLKHKICMEFKLRQGQFFLSMFSPLSCSKVNMGCCVFFFGSQDNHKHVTLLTSVFFNKYTTKGSINEDVLGRSLKMIKLFMDFPNKRKNIVRPFKLLNKKSRTNA